MAAIQKLTLPGILDLDKVLSPWLPAQQLLFSDNNDSSSIVVLDCVVLDKCSLGNGTTIY